VSFVGRTHIEIESRPVRFVVSLRIDEDAVELALFPVDPHDAAGQRSRRSGRFRVVGIKRRRLRVCDHQRLADRLRIARAKFRRVHRLAKSLDNTCVNVSRRVRRSRKCRGIRRQLILTDAAQHPVLKRRASLRKHRSSLRKQDRMPHRRRILQQRRHLRISKPQNRSHPWKLPLKIQRPSDPLVIPVSNIVDPGIIYSSNI